MICLPEIKTAELSTYGNFAMCHQAHFSVPHVGLGTRLTAVLVDYTVLNGWADTTCLSSLSTHLAPTPVQRRSNVPKPWTLNTYSTVVSQHAHKHFWAFKQGNGPFSGFPTGPQALLVFDKRHSGPPAP